MLKATLKSLLAPLLSSRDRHGAGDDRAAEDTAAAALQAGFDADFYRAFYLDHEWPDADAARHHWSENGRREGRFANAGDMLSSHPRIAELPPSFDIVEYVFDSPDLARVFPHRWQYVLHYLDNGRHEGRKTATGLFDPVFVEQVYGLSGLEPGEAIAALRERLGHSLGQPAVIYRSAEHAMRFAGILNKQFPDRLDATFYAAAAGLGEETKAKALVHFCETGLLGLKPFNAVDVFNYDYWSERFGPVPGIPALSAVAMPVRAYLTWLNRDLPRHIAGADQKHAEPHYRAAVESGTASALDFRMLAEIYAGSGRVAEAVALLRRSRTQVPGDQGLIGYEEQLADRYQGDSWAEARRLLPVQGAAAAQARMAEGARLAVYEPLQRAGRLPIRRIALVANLSLAQCTLYRVEQKAEQCRAAGFEVEIFDAAQDLLIFQDRIFRFQAAIFFRVAAAGPVSRAIQAARGAGLVTFYEIDDAIFEPSIYPPPREDYGALVSWEEYEGLQLGVPLFALAMEQCDHVIASTRPLARLMALHTKGAIFVHENAIGSRHETAIARGRPPRRPGDPVTIFYGTATKGHKQDFQELMEPALERLAAKYGSRIRIILVGYSPLSDRSPALAAAVDLRPLTANFDDYLKLLAESDINLSALKPSKFNDAKSAIKWLEPAMLGIPSVVPRLPVFEDVVDSGVDGFLCKTADDYFNALASLVENDELRAHMGARARDRALARYAPDVMARHVKAMIDAVDVPVPPRRLKALVVHVYYAPQTVGGASRVVEDNVRELRKLAGDELEIEVYATVEGSHLPPYMLTTYGIDGVRVTAISTPLRGDATPTDPIMAEVFARFLDECRPDIIHFHCIQRMTASIAEVARDRGIPYVITAHDGWWISDHQFLISETGKVELYDYNDNWKTFFERGSASARRALALVPALAGAEAVLAVSEPFRRIYEAAGVRNVRLVENGVSGHMTDSGRTGKTAGRVVIGHVGGLEYHKGAWLLEEALRGADFRNLEVLIIDHAKPRGYRGHEKWGGTDVTVTAKVGQGAIGGLYGRMNVLAAPSIWPESFGLVTREALSAGCWVIASDRGSIGDPVVEGENGFIVPVEDVKALRQRLGEINDDPERFLVPPATRPVLRTSHAQAVDLWEIYRELAAKKC